MDNIWLDLELNKGETLLLILNLYWCFSLMHIVVDKESHFKFLIIHCRMWKEHKTCINTQRKQLDVSRGGMDGQIVDFRVLS